MLDARIHNLIARWEAHWEAGTPISPEELCRDCPECLPAVRQRIAALRALAPVQSLDTVDFQEATAQHPALPANLPTIPGYDLQRVIDQGGMGVVYRAVQRDLKRPVAIKMLRAEISARPHVQARFRREAEVLANLRHDHIVPVHAADLYHGQPYFVMDLVEGGNLAAHLERFRADPRAAAALMEQVARAVHFAHRRGVLHRDLKPANILLDADDKPLVSDFGLAKLLVPDPGDLDTPVDRGRGDWGTSPRLTQTGGGPGTPAYMAPEQFASTLTTGVGADVWGLGVILYELVAGRHPFAGVALADLPEHVRTQAPPAPRTLKPQLAPALEAIILRCLAVDPGRRYPTAAALADELGKWRRGELGPWRQRFGGKAYRLALVGLVVFLATGIVLLLGVDHQNTTPRPRMTQEEIEEDQYQEKVRPLQQALHQGRSVNLILPDGRCRAARWRVGEGLGSVELLAGPTPAMAVVAPHALVELFPDPAVARFRLTAEIRHERNTSDFGEVGLFFGHTGLPTGGKVHHLQLAYAFSDLGKKAWGYTGPQGQMGSRPRVHLQHYLSPGLPAIAGANAEHGVLSGAWYPPHNRLVVPGPWRTLEVIVSSNHAKVFWEGGALGEVDQSDCAPGFQQWANRFPDLRGPLVNQAPRGSLGIYVFGGAASVRRLQIDPLPKP